MRLRNLVFKLAPQRALNIVDPRFQYFLFFPFITAGAFFRARKVLREFLATALLPKRRGGRRALRSVIPSETQKCVLSSAVNVFFRILHPSAKVVGQYFANVPFYFSNFKSTCSKSLNRKSVFS